MLTWLQRRWDSKEKSHSSKKSQSKPEADKNEDFSNNYDAEDWDEKKCSLWKCMWVLWEQREDQSAREDDHQRWTVILRELHNPSHPPLLTPGALPCLAGVHSLLQQYITWFMPKITKLVKQKPEKKPVQRSHDLLKHEGRKNDIITAADLGTFWWGKLMFRMSLWGANTTELCKAQGEGKAIVHYYVA